MSCCHVCCAAREHVVGWYSTGPRLREADLSIHQLMSNYVTTPVLVICEVEVRQLTKVLRPALRSMQSKSRQEEAQVCNTSNAVLAVSCSWGSSACLLLLGVPRLEQQS